MDKSAILEPFIDEEKGTKKEHEIIINSDILSDVDIPQSNQISRLSIWTRHVYLFWLVSCLAMISHTYIIGLLQEEPLFAGGLVVLYIIAISITSFFRNVELIKLTCYEYQFIFWTLWIMYSFVCKGIPDYLHYITIIISNILTVVCVMISLLPESYTENNRNYVSYLLVIYLSALIIPHVDANILHASPLISTIRTSIYCILFIWIRYNKLLNVDYGEFYNVYYYKEIPTILEIWNSRNLSQFRQTKVVMREKLYIPPWAVGIMTTWIFLCDPIVLLLVPIQFYIIYIMGGYGDKDNHKYIISKHERLATIWPFKVIRDQSIQFSSRILTTSNTIDDINQQYQKNNSKITGELVKKLNETVSLYRLTHTCPQHLPSVLEDVKYQDHKPYSEKVVINEMIRLKYLEIITSNNVRQDDITDHNRACSYIYGLHHQILKLLTFK